MPTTMALLEKALTIKRAAAWARELNLSEAAFTQAKKRGRLSPTMAGTLAEQLHEDAARWTAVAAIEAEPDTPLRQRLLRSLERQWRNS
jgi:hypothetical protein